MARQFSRQIAQNFLTLALLILLAVFVSNVSCDLAPKEEEDDDVARGAPQEDLKRDEVVPAVVTTLKPADGVSNLGFIHAFIASFSVIIVSEIGDKTFFIAAIMSMVSDDER